MTTAAKKEYTLTITQIIGICLGCLLPGLGGFYALRERVAIVEKDYATQVAAAEQKNTELKEQLKDVAENVTLIRIQLASLFPAKSQPSTPAP